MWDLENINKMVWAKLIRRNFGRYLSCGANPVLKNSRTVEPVREAGATARGPPPGGRKGRVRRGDQVPPSVYSRCALWGCPAGCSTCRRACSRVASARRRSGSASVFSLSPFFGTPSRTPHNRTPRSRPKGLRQKHQAVSLAPSKKHQKHPIFFILFGARWKGEKNARRGSKSREAGQLANHLDFG